MDIILALLASVAVTLGVALQYWLGIGLALLAAPLLFLIDPAYLPGPVLMIGFGLALWSVLERPGTWRWRHILPALLARFPGAWLGAWLLTSMLPSVLGLIFGTSLLLTTLLSRRQAIVRQTPHRLALAGFCSGLLGTITSIGSPPMALIYQSQPRESTRTDLAQYFMLGIPISLLMLWLEQRLDAQSLILSAQLLPGLILGRWLSRCLQRHLQERWVRPLLQGFAAVAGLFILSTGLLALSD